MRRILLPVFLAACAELPEIRPCEPTVRVLPPVYLGVGNDDLLLASLQYRGCPDYPFYLCGIGDPWFAEDRIGLGIAYEEATLRACDDAVMVDELFNLRPLRDRYEDQFDVDTAEILLDISGVEVLYSFAPDER